MEEQGPIWVAVRKVGRIEYGKETSVIGERPFLSLAADDGSGLMAMLIDANTRLIEISRSNGDSSSVAVDEKLLYQF